MRYVTGYTGSNGLALVAATERSVGARRAAPFLTDFRYDAQSAAEVRPSFERTIVTGELLDAVSRAARRASAGRLGFDAAKLERKAHAQLAEARRGLGARRRGGLVEELRSVKEPGEIAPIARCRELVDGLCAASSRRASRGAPSARSPSIWRCDAPPGAEAPSFPSIVVAGAHGALPHGSRGMWRSRATCW